MIRKYKDTDTVSKADLKKEYYALMMEDDELPSYVILDMEEMRIVLEEVFQYIKLDNDFMLDILSNLPEGKEGELELYQVERKLIEPKINDNNEPYTIEDLSRDLDRLCNSLNKKEEKVETKKTPE
jgi:translation elongation factor P/translation initiation factor 5A